MSIKYPALAASFLALAACDPLVQNTNTSRFATPDMMGGFTGTLSEERGGSERVAAGGYAYRVGFDTDGDALAEAGLFADTDVGTAAVSGLVFYSGTYEVATTTGISTQDGVATGFTGTGSGPMTLTADFDTGAFGGTGSNLTIGGILDGAGMSGTVTYDGIGGTLTGQIGAETAIGAFHGSDDTSVFSGGFIVTSD